MDDRTNVELFGDILDRLLDGEEVEVGDEDLASLLKAARRLQQEAPKDEPDPEFQARLRQGLVNGDTREKTSLLQPPLDVRRWRPVPLAIPRWAGVLPRPWRHGAACTALILVAAVAWLGLCNKTSGSVDGQLAYLPSLLGVASAYAQQMGEDGVEEIRRQLGDASFRLVAALPKAPEKARVYRQVREPIDQTGARELARHLGIEVSSVVDDTDYGIFVVKGEGGSLVVNKVFRGYFSFDTNMGPDSDPLQPAPQPPSLAPPDSAATPAPDDAGAIRAAREFLQGRGLLSFDYRVEAGSDAPPGATPVYRQVTFVPTVDGRPVRGLGIVVTVGSGGKVTALQSANAKLVPGDAYPILKPEEAFRQLQENSPDVFQMRVRKDSGSSDAGFSTGVSSVFRSGGKPKQEADLPSYLVGEEVELEGLLSAVVYEAKDGHRRYSATLLTGPREAPTRAQFRLSGPALEDLSQLDQQHVRVWGQVEGLSIQPPGGRLRLQHFEKLYPQERLVALLGRLEIEGQGDDALLVLTTDDGKKYALESPGGARYQREQRGRRAIAEGRTTERTSKQGYPVIELAGIRAGTDVDGMADLSIYQMQRPQVVQEREPMLSGEVLVDRAYLEYYATAAAGLPPRFIPPELEPFLLVQPIYSFSGTFDEGNGFFEADVQAVRPKYVEWLK